MGNTIYKNIIYDIKKQLYEMARKSVNRTIDKKLWLTVSSIISRNRSTEAENIKPIGNDKNNLLQRYVAALLIMKKPCPETIEDISKLKTFKKVGYKFIDLGGTIQDIQKLYNENSNNINFNNSTNTNISSNNSGENDNDDFFNNSFNNSSSSSLSFFDDIENDIDNVDNVSIEIDKLTTTINNKTSIQQAYNEVTGAFDIPNKLKLIKSSDPNIWQHMESIVTSEKSYNGFHDKNGFSYFGKYINILETKYNWKYFINPIIKEFSDIPPVNFSKYNNINDIIKNAKEYGNKLSNDQQELYNDYIDRNKARYEQIFKSYNNFINSIDNDIVRKIFENNAFITYILISPDNGLYFSHSLQDIQIIDNHNFNILKDAMKFINYSTNSVLRLKYFYQYKLEFTGENNYYNIQTDKNINQIYKDNKKQNEIKKKYFSIFKSITNTYVRQLDKRCFKDQTWKDIDNFTYNNTTCNFSAHSNVGSYIFSDNYTIVDSCWGKNKRDMILRTTQKNKYGKYSKFHVVTNISDPNVIACIADIDGYVYIKQYKQKNNQSPIISFELSPVGLLQFKLECNKKHIPIIND